MGILSVEDNKNNIVKKHTDMILHSRYKLSEHSIKAISMLISMIKVSDEDFKEYILHSKEFRELINTKSKDYSKEMKNIVQELLNADIKIEKEESVFMSKWIISGEYAKGGGYLKMMIHPYLKPYFLKLNGNFLQYNVKNILLLRSVYVIRLYELLKLNFSEYIYYNKNQDSFTFELKIDKLREQFEIPVSYQYSSHIKKLIIDKAQKQLKEKTDIVFTYKEQKIGRKVDRLIITVKKNNKGSSDFLSTEQNFINYMRKNYVNVDILKAKDKNTNKIMIISISTDGKLYNKENSKSFDAKRSKELWQNLYQMSKDKKLAILN